MRARDKSTDFLTHSLATDDWFLFDGIEGNVTINGNPATIVSNTGKILTISYDFVAKMPTVEDHIAYLKGKVEALCLNKGLANALTGKLDQVLKLLRMGDDKAFVAINVLNAFISQVDSLEYEEKLTEGQAELLRNVANDIILNIMQRYGGMIHQRMPDLT